MGGHPVAKSKVAAVVAQRSPSTCAPRPPLAERVLLPGDPGRALALAQALLVEPRMFNHHRGLWGYTGTAPDGEPLTIQATGMGGPSAAIVLTELIALGARRAIRVGTCGALAAGPRARRAGDRARGDLRGRHLRGRSARASARRADPAPDGGAGATAPAALLGTIVSVDLFYETGDAARARRDALAVEMEAAALFAVGRARGVPVGCVLAVSDTFDASGARERIDDDTLLSAAERWARSAIAALAAER